MNWPWVSRKRLQAVELLLASEAERAEKHERNASFLSGTVTTVERERAKHERNSKTLQSVVATLREEAKGLREAAVKLKVENAELTKKLNDAAASRGTFNPRRVPFHAAGGAKQQLEAEAFNESVEGRKIRTAEAVLGATDNAN